MIEHAAVSFSALNRFHCGFVGVSVLSLEMTGCRLIVMYGDTNVVLVCECGDCL